LAPSAFAGSRRSHRLDFALDVRDGIIEDCEETRASRARFGGLFCAAGCLIACTCRQIAWLNHFRHLIWFGRLHWLGWLGRFGWLGEIFHLG
jgi:hypothetical protein